MSNDMVLHTNCSFSLFESASNNKYTQLMVDTHKKVFLVVGPLRGGGVKPPQPLSKKTLFSSKEKTYEKNMFH